MRLDDCLERTDLNSGNLNLGVTQNDSEASMVDDVKKCD